MSTNLYAISNTSLKGQNTSKDWDVIVKKLKALNIGRSGHYDANNKYQVDKSEWHYEVEDVNEFNNVFYIDFWGPTMFHISLYKDICIIGSFYKYAFIYQNYSLDYFANFRKNLFDIMNIFGGTELIYLADNGCNHLSKYLELYAMENTPYQILKDKIQNDLGNPITNYQDLNHIKDLYQNTEEYFLENFNDL